MAQKQKSIIAPDNYYELSKPFDSAEEAEKAFNGFWDEFYELRNKYRIRDAYVIMALPIAGSGDVISSAHAGDQARAEALAAWAHGRESAQRQERIAAIYGDACKGVPKVNRM